MNEVTTIGLDGASQPMFRYMEDMHMPDHLRRIVAPEHRPDTPHGSGYHSGSVAGSWVIDGNTTRATAQRIWQGYDNGDPEVMDMCNPPLGGEFAEGFEQGFWDEVTKSISAMFDFGDHEENQE